jgi:STAS-like domain of unknown function (DUF4325)
MLDGFDISSGAVYFASPSSLSAHPPSSMINPPSVAGTAVWMKLRNNIARSGKEMVDAFASPEKNYAFDKIIVPLKMAEQSSNDLVSRSQAKRLLLRIDRFRTAVLDFTNVKEIGPAFADEIFRVFARSHPGIEMQFVKANDDVTR